MPSRVLSNTVVGTGERVLSGAGWVSHTQEPRISPGPAGSPKGDHYKSALPMLSLRLPQNIARMPSAGARPRAEVGHAGPPEEVAEGKPLLPDVSPAPRQGLVIFAIIFPICVPASLAPGSPLPTALQYAQPGPNCHVFIYPVLCISL